MEYEIRQIHLSVEKLGLPDINYGEENTDVIVEMTDGNLYAASFYSYGNLDKVIARHRASGEFLDGKYFWVEGMVFVLNCEMNTIAEVVRYQIDEGDFDRIFKLL